MSVEDDRDADTPDPQADDAAVANPAVATAPPSAGPTTFDEALRAATPRAWVTPTIVGLNVAVFVAMVATGVSPSSPTTGEIFKWGAVYGPATVLDGQWWRTIASAFVHIGALHLAFNMYALFKAGVTAERIYGNGAYLALYLVAAVAGSLASVVWTPMVVCAGASGAVFGVYGSLLSFALAGHESLRLELMELRQSVLGFVGYNFVVGLTTPGISNAAHLGGLVAGLAAGWLLTRDVLTLSAARAGRFLRAGALLPAVATLAWGAHHRVSGLPYYQGVVAEKAGDLKKAAALYKQACDSGEMQGCFNMGMAYAQGQGVAEDHGRAAVFYGRACEAGVPSGCGMSRRCLRIWPGSSQGRGASRRRSTGAPATAASCSAARSLGSSYVLAAACPRMTCGPQPSSSRRATAGTWVGCVELGLVYESGRGVPKDVVQGGKSLQAGVRRRPHACL